MKCLKLFKLAALTWIIASTAWAQTDALPSWNDGPSKKAITEFVAKVTREGSPDFVKPDERIAVFDNDGTLWCEQPMYFQFMFAMDRIKAMANVHPEWHDVEPYKSVINGDMKGLAASGEKGLLQIVAATHAGMTTDEYARLVREWIDTARHPKYNRSYTLCVYQPMLEVLRYLREKGFKTFIVSGGGVEFMRVFAEETYGIPPEQVVGSSGEVRYELREGTPFLVKEPKVEFVDDGPGKSIGINRFIGRRPVMAFGNSDGDLQMLLWTTTSPGPRFGLLIHHTDSEREFAYDRQTSIGRLDKALDEVPRRGWIVVDMKTDWKTVFPAK
ncbi:MAG TPA: HAD family hydrolase [Tepidisphaeraceae bacterium]|nr:HAD family hydrolase [Tepidisphaeraceae bacterium]